ncbi:MAG: nucleotidyltransferase family protein [Candidatus Riflebacteria bacterium]|nr:nucleotidyltransferase family protein [Candidatus Riflebacteria bacterium]
MPEPFSLSSVCLLAGRSSRMGRAKQHVCVGGRTFLEHLLAGLAELGSALAPPLAFVGQGDDAVGRALAEGAGGTWVVNPRPEDGPLSSIRLALDLLPPGRSFLLWPVDHPLVQPSTLAALVAAARHDPGALVVPSFEQRRGHPVVFPGWAAAELRQAPLEEGARWVFQRHPERIVHVTVDDRWVRFNLNTPEALAEAERLLTRE